MTDAVVVDPPDDDPPDVDPPDVELDELDELELDISDELDPSPHPASRSIGARIGAALPNMPSLVDTDRLTFRFAAMMPLLDNDDAVMVTGMAEQYGWNMGVSAARPASNAVPTGATRSGWCCSRSWA